MVGGREFDVAELSASEFISLMGRGDCPFVALPVFPSRVFRHGYIFINTRSRHPRAEGPRRQARRAAALHPDRRDLGARTSAHQFGVDLDTIRWVQGAVEKAGTHGKPHAPAAAAAGRRSSRTASGEPLGALLARGEIDALIGSRKPDELGRHPDVARLFPDYRALERELYQTTEDLSDHASHRHPPRALRAAALDRDEPLQRIRRIEAPRPRPHALRRLARAPCCRG